MVFCASTVATFNGILWLSRSKGSSKVIIDISDKRCSAIQAIALPWIPSQSRTSRNVCFPFTIGIGFLTLLVVGWQPIKCRVQHTLYYWYVRLDSSGLGDSARAPKKLRVSNPFFYIFWNFYLYSFWTPLFMKIHGKRRNHHPGFYTNGFCLIFEYYEHHLKHMGLC